MADLLPPNATELERALAAATDRPVPVIVREVWNPDTCPAAILPWLAWAYSLDEWDSTWTEEQKRGAIKASVFVHRKKGTIGALRAALGGIGYEIDVTEWHQEIPAGDPYTFRLGVTVNQIGIPDASVYARLAGVAASAKNLRSHLTGIDVNARTSGTEYIAARVIAGEIVNISAEPSA